MKLLPKPLVLLCAWAVLSMARAETVITLPEGDTEHFSVQNAYLFPLLHVDAAAVRTGTNIAFGSMGSELSVVVSSQTVARFLSDPIRGSLIVGSNRIASAQANFIAGHTNYVYLSPYSSILGGRENQIVYHASLASYYSSIVGGTRNAIYGSQKSLIAGGEMNVVTNGPLYAVIGGGFQNTVTGRGGTIPGGEYNAAAGSNTFAAGTRAQALHDGAFVWADQSVTNAFASSNANEFAVRAAGGVRFESDLGPDPLPNRKARFADNNIVAWGRVSAEGSISTAHFGVESCTSPAEGEYDLLLDVAMGSPATLIPVATADTFNLLPPTNAANARLIYVERTMEPNRFIVRTTTGAFVPTNTAFTFIVTGR
ncbi:MAG: hypothetical protein PHR34_08075 [Kiritimatiellae bacterium]|nr:hypothetical protein [Kiritimatiellia bacterium]MDD3440529.1 hypothetical protein [Kiritimatiellia bacterium]